MIPRYISILAAVLFVISGKAAERPKLVVAIVVDQMRYDYLERRPDLFAANGFRLLLDRGAFMTSAKFNYVPTVTGPGHASYLSGSGPAVHGILGNDWYDKKAGRDIYCCADSSVKAVGTTNKSAMSPKNFIGSTVADEMRLALGSKVISVSLKDRGAILPAGKKPAGVFWFDSKTGNFITSTYYMTNLPTWLEEFNGKKIPQSYAGKKWERLFDVKEYTGTDEGMGEGKYSKNTTNVFPHTLVESTNTMEVVVEMPFGDEIVAQLAMAAIDGEGLGQTEGRTDLLCVSFSSTDPCGHKFGPYSHEIQDLTFRLDRQFEKLFNHLDEKVGLQNVTMVLTADHAVAPAPEFAKMMGLDGNRWSAGAFMTNLVTQLEDKYGTGRFFRTMKIPYGDVFLNHSTFREKGIPLETVSSFIRDQALASGLFQAVYTREQLLNGTAAGWIGLTVLNGYNQERGADLVMVAKPYSLQGTNTTGTGHSSPYSYDTRVPVVFYGKQFKSGRYADEFYITDIAATLSAALRITEPAGSIGKVAVRILAE